MDSAHAALTVLCAVAEQTLEELRKIDLPRDPRLLASIEEVRKRAFAALADIPVQ
jgi:hypothetical protein